jgi:aminoglycoside 3-N-acetyltransferase I
MSLVPKGVVRELTSRDVSDLRALLVLFGDAFDEASTYAQHQPDDDYLTALLGRETFMTLVAKVGDEVVGGLTAYDLIKPEQVRSEIYIYDLAVRADHRRHGVATALISKLKEIAAGRNAHVIFVQADLEDAPAIALYDKLGAREDVLHFDIDVNDIAT